MDGQIVFLNFKSLPMDYLCNAYGVDP